MFLMDSPLPALLVGWFVKSLALLGLAVFLVWVMRRSSAATRHLSLSIAIVAVLVLPLASAVLPSWGPFTLPDPFAAVGDSGTPAPQRTAVPEEVSTAPAQGGEPGSTGVAAAHASGMRWVRWITWFLVLWGAGALILLARLVAGNLYGYRITATAPAVEDEHLLHAVRQAEKRVGVTRPVPVVESDHEKVPFVWGVFRPRLVLPPQARLWMSGRLDAVLRHELAHVKRRDLVTQFLAKIACCLYWVNPFVWFVERKLLIERERACDDIAMSLNTKASDYAGYLMETVEELGTPKSHVWVVSAMAEGTDFRDRVLSVLDPAAKRTGPSASLAAAAITLSALLLLPLAAIHPSSRAAGTPREPTSSNTEREEPVTARSRSRLDALIVLLAESDADGREHAATALGEWGDPAAVPDLLVALGDPNASVREHVCTALGMIGDDTAAPSLIRVLLSDPVANVREHAASALGGLGPNDHAYRALVDVYERDESVRVRAHAAYGLGLMRELRAFELLLDGLDSRHPVIRMHCADALGYIGDPRAVSRLRQARRDNDQSVRDAAEQALTRILDSR